MTTLAPAAVEVHDLAVRADGHTLLDGVSLALPEGEHTLLVDGEGRAPTRAPRRAAARPTALAAVAAVAAVARARGTRR